MIRVVLDANVYVSAAIARDNRSPSVRIVHAATARQVETIICPRLLGEIGSVLSRERLRRLLSLEEALAFVEDLPAFTTLVANPAEPYPEVCRDSDDDYLLALASEQEAELLCTGDRDLLDLPQEGIPIVSPRAFVERLDAEQ